MHIHVYMYTTTTTPFPMLTLGTLFCLLLFIDYMTSDVHPHTSDVHPHTLSHTHMQSAEMRWCQDFIFSESATLHKMLAPLRLAVDHSKLGRR